MQKAIAHTTAPHAAEWITAAPYTAMLADYSAAAERLQQRIAELRQSLRCCAAAGTLESARAQTLLEALIQMLRNEYEDTQRVMQTLRGYAAREVQS